MYQYPGISGVPGMMMGGVGGVPGKSPIDGVPGSPGMIVSGVPGIGGCQHRYSRTGCGRRATRLVSFPDPEVGDAAAGCWALRDEATSAGNAYPSADARMVDLT